MTIKNFFFSSVIVLASATGFSMEGQDLGDYVKRFKEKGDIFECSPEFRENKNLMNTLYPALAQAIEQDSGFNTLSVYFKYLEATNVNPLVNSFARNSHITSVSFQYCHIDAAIIESLKAMLGANRTLQHITFTCPYLDEDLVEQLQAIANEDKRVVILAPNPDRLDSKY